MPDLLEAVNDYLLARGVGRDPRVAGPLPPLWVEEDVPAPGESPSGNASEKGAAAVIGVQYATGLPSRPFASDRRHDGAEFIIRVLDSRDAFAIERQLLDAFLHGNGPSIAGHLAYDMAGLFVLECRVWRALQPVERTPQARTYSCEFLFETYA